MSNGHVRGLAKSCAVLPFVLMVVLSPCAYPATLDPFFPGSDLQGYSEIALFWNSPPTGTVQTYGKLYDLQEGLPPDTANLLEFDRQNPGSLPSVGSPRNIASATGDFNGDKISDPIVVWNGPGDSVRVMIPQIIDGSYGWDNASTFSIPGGGATVLVNTGNFDDDRQDEFVVTYAGADSLIHMDIYDTDSTFVPRFVRSLTPDSAHTVTRFYRDFSDPGNPPTPPGKAGVYAVVCGDFNADHVGELMLLAASPRSDGGWDVQASLFRDPLNDAEPQLRKHVYSAVPVNYLDDTARVVGIDIVAVRGNFDPFTGDEAALALHVAEVRSPNPNRYYDSTFLAVIRIAEDPDDIVVSAFTARDYGNQDGDLTLAAGDLTGDGLAELAMYYRRSLQVFYIDDLAPVLQLETSIGANSSRFFTSSQSVTIGDMDEDLRSELIVVDNVFDPSADVPTQFFNLHVFNTTTSLDSLILKCRLLEDESQSSNSNYNSGRRFVVVMGDFTGDRLRLGTPTYTIDRDISQPLVILNSPPIHFDILNGTTYDVSGCFNAQSCGFSSTYERSTSTTVQVTTEVNADWSMEYDLTAALTGETETPIGKVSASLERNINLKYGYKFSKVRKSSHTVNIGVKVQATSSDQIYGMVSDYEVWEYPVYDDTGLVGHIAVVKPTVKESRWFPASSWTGFSYVPNHQVGNILSYSNYNGLSEIDYLDEPIKVNVGDGFTLGPTTSFEWTLGYEDFSSEQASTTHSFGIGLGLKTEVGIEAGFKYAGLELKVGAKVTANYRNQANLSLVSTLETTVKETMNLKAALGGIASGDDKAYEVIPYAYWGKSGALVLDFAARPQVAPPGYPITWWQQQYATRPDPGLLLPFLYDQQKGLVLTDPEKRFLTKEILLEPAHPEIGDTVTITTRVHNLSLVPLDDHVRLRFYVGNPSSGGTAITPIDQPPDIFTDSSSIAARGQAFVQFKWLLPPDAPRYAHIYAVVDPDGELDEIHEDNNMGFAVLGNEDGVVPTGIDDEPFAGLLPDAYALMQNYPNPFNPATTIEYYLPVKSDVKLAIYNVLGQEVRSIVAAEKSSGRHAEVWDGCNDDGAQVASGVYFYKLLADDYSESKKMLLLK